MQFIRKYWRELSVSVLILVNIFVWVRVYANGSSDWLHVYFLDVGQGDAILIDSPSHNRILVDGGKNRQILSELGKILPFGDRRLDVIVATHPDADHIGGLPEVITRYNVGLLLESGVESDNSIDDELRRRSVSRGVERMLARRGLVINLGDGVLLTILFPDRDVSGWDPNDASVVARLTYGENSFLLTGDSPLQIENLLISTHALIQSEVLKVGHHGSRTSTSLDFARVVSPEFAIISAGRDNSYGHPHQEVLNILESVGAQVFITANSGTIRMQSDGRELHLK